MLKRIAFLAVVGSFLAVPPGIAKSSSTVKAPVAKQPAAQQAPHSDGQCPFSADTPAL